LLRSRSKDEEFMIYLRVGEGNGMERKKSKRMGLERDWDCGFSGIPFGSYTNFIISV
jgi:hypothetical protein